MSEEQGSKRKAAQAASSQEAKQSTGSRVKKDQQKGEHQGGPPAAGAAYAPSPSAVYSAYPHPAYLPPGSYGRPHRARYPYRPAPPPSHGHYPYYRPHSSMPSTSAEGHGARSSKYVTPDPRHQPAHVTPASSLHSRRGVPRSSASRHPAVGRRELTTSPSNASPASTFSSPAGSSGIRYDSSLGALTRRFVDLLKSIPGQSIDLNDAVKQLGVQKRRIYDITNVLEGIGMIRKDGKNSVAWCGELEVDFNAPQDEQIEKVKRQHEQQVAERQTESKEKNKTRKELQEARAHEQQLDSYLRQLGDQVAHYTQEGDHLHGFDYRAHPASASALPHGVHQPHPYMYIRYSDLANHPGYKDDNLIALRAPRGTSIEVPEPEQSGKQGKRSYQMYMTSQSRNRITGRVQPGQPIDVHLVRPSAEKESGTTDNNSTKEQAKASVQISKDSAPPSPVGSTPKKAGTQSIPAKQTQTDQHAHTATRPPPFQDVSTGPPPYWHPTGNPVSPWLSSPVQGRYQYVHHDFSLGPAASPQRQSHLHYSYSPLHHTTSKRPQSGNLKDCPADTPEREREAMGLMNSPLGEVMPSTPAGTRNEGSFTSTPTYATQGSSTGSLGDLERSDSPLYELPSLASLPPIYSPHPGSSRMRFSPSPLEWRFPGESSPEKESSED